MKKTLVLIEGKNDVKILQDQLAIKDYKIVTFDFYAHKFLRNLKIDHDIVEDYFGEDEKNLADNEAIRMNSNWYRGEFMNLHEFNGINLGSLLELELLEYFFGNLKRVIGILRIIDKEKPDAIISSSLGGFVDCLCKNKDIQSLRFTKQIANSSLYYDKIYIPIDILGRHFSIKISRARFIQIKKFFEKTVNTIFRTEQDLGKTYQGKTVLLLDFNTILYEDLLKEISQTNHKILLLNQRRPAIWNMKSLEIIKKSGCKVIRLESVIDRDISSKIEHGKNIVQNNLKYLWSQEKFFREFFTVGENSFWDAMKENFFNIVNKRYNESVFRILALERLIERIDVSLVFEWAYVGQEEKIVNHFINKKNLPIVFLQHGLYPQNLTFRKYMPFMPIIPYNDAKKVDGET